MTAQRAADLTIERNIRDGRQYRLLACARRRVRQLDTIPAPLDLTIPFVRASIGLARSIGLSQDQIAHVNRHVFSKPQGEVIQEVGGTAVTLMALCESVEISLWDAEATAADRVITPGGSGARGTCDGTMERIIRDNRQYRVLEWARRVFGVPGRSDTASPQERSLRFIEEAIELAQAVGLDELSVAEINRLACPDPVGVPFDETGRTSVTLMGLCESLEISFWEAEVTEFDRVLSKTPEHFQARQAEKRAAGLEYAP